MLCPVQEKFGEIFETGRCTNFHKEVPTNSFNNKRKKNAPVLSSEYILHPLE